MPISLWQQACQQGHTGPASAAAVETATSRRDDDSRPESSLSLLSPRPAAAAASVIILWPAPAAAPKAQQQRRATRTPLLSATQVWLAREEGGELGCRVRGCGAVRAVRLGVGISASASKSKGGAAGRGCRLPRRPCRLCLVSHPRFAPRDLRRPDPSTPPSTTAAAVTPLPPLTFPLPTPRIPIGQTLPAFVPACSRHVLCKRRASRRRFCCRRCGYLLGVGQQGAASTANANPARCVAARDGAHAQFPISPPPSSPQSPCSSPRCRPSRRQSR